MTYSLSQTCCLMLVSFYWPECLPILTEGEEMKILQHPGPTRSPEAPGMEVKPPGR